MIDAEAFVAAHKAAGVRANTPGQNQQASTDDTIRPNPDRTHEAQPRVRLYVAQPRGTA